MRYLIILIVLLHMSMQSTSAQERSETVSLGSGGASNVQQKQKQIKLKTKSKYDNILKIGLIVGQGFEQIHDDYFVAYYKPELFLQLWHNSNWKLDLLAQPQVNFTFYKQKTSDTFVTNKGFETGFETGLNIGWVLRKSLLKESLDVYFLTSIGPHFISGSPERQVKGFIFSDNLFLGLSKRIVGDLYADLRFGFRHLSNGDIVLPNYGINSWIVLGGMFMYL